MRSAHQAYLGDVGLFSGRVDSFLFRCCVVLGVLFLLPICLDSARAATVTCEGGPLVQGEKGADLEVIGECIVSEGKTYHFGNVNVWGGGSLIFEDPAPGKEIHFWAKSILVETDSSLIAGTPDLPIGDRCQAARDRGEDVYCGRLITIHLYGRDQEAGGVGISCKSDVKTCGVDEGIWSSNGSRKMTLPGNVEDYFYAYEPLMMDDGNPNGYFGYKVLALSYNGTLQMTGRKGATNDADRDPNPSYSGTSWVRLAKDLKQNQRELVLNRKVDWEPGDKIVVTTTDYLPGHSEELTIDGISFDGKTVTVKEPAKYFHSGRAYPLTVKGISDLGLKIITDGKAAAETRAAVALLTRSICIRSEGDVDGQSFPPAPASGAGYYFGGHTVIRQGFKTYHMQGVEFYQMGQGGRMGHYPIHFHMARKTPPGTYVKDCSVNESMTRWITVHATQDLDLWRNVGYKSIGHGFYLEDGTEINNRFYSNIGIFARAAVANPQNPRQVPGILAWKGAQAISSPPYNSDVFNPSVFWIMNGWNDFKYNMAAGAGGCGVCYWLLPGANSGPSQGRKWESYASMQSGPVTGDYEKNMERAGMTPLKSFVGNGCSTAMMSFNTVGDTDTCLGMSGLGVLPNPDAPEPKGDRNEETFYPKVTSGGGRFATRCDQEDCSGIPRCGNGPNRKDCMVTVLDRYTSSFHWAQQNFAAVWLRPQWYLFINSVLTDTQNGGLGFVTGGDYLQASVVPGLWQLARKSVFIGHTQENNPLAYNAGPFNPDGLTCEGNAANFCRSGAEGISIPLDNFAVNQRLFNIYDGPNYQDSNAFLDIKKTPLDPLCLSQECGKANPEVTCCPQFGDWMYTRTIGIPVDHQTGKCVLPNAAIGWKQPNGFFYPPGFHSMNLFFHNVDIRHYVLEPLWLPGTYDTDEAMVRKDYCRFNTTGTFGNFSSVDRQTVLNDDDGSLTGLVSSARNETISVNLDPFFNAPVEAPECESFNTAKTSPYEYVSTVVYPDCAVNRTCTPLWGRPCTNAECYGVPLERQRLTALDDMDLTSTGIRMAGMDLYQRSMLTLNNSTYYIDTTVSENTQRSSGASSLNVFESGKTYYVFLLYAKPTTRQTYEIFVGQGADKGYADTVKGGRASLAQDPISFTDDPSLKWDRDYDPDSGILTVTMDLSGFGSEFEEAKLDFCQPESFCELNVKKTGCQCSAYLMATDPVLYQECLDGNICGTFAGKDIDCPLKGCFGFKVTLPSAFVADDGLHRPDPSCFPENAEWNVQWKNAGSEVAGTCFDPDKGMTEFCMD